MTAMYPGFLKYHQDKITAKDEPRIGARSLGRVKRTVVHAPNKLAGKYAMPVVAVVAAVASFATGVATVAAATGIVGAIVGGAMIVGAAMTVVGTITGNEKLTKWGGILSLAGGIGGALTGTLVNPLAAGTTAGVDAAPPMAEMAGPSAGVAEAGNVASNAASTGSSLGGILKDAAPMSEMAGTTTSTAADAVAKAGAASTTPDAFNLGINTNAEIPGMKVPTTFAANNSAGSGILNWVKENKDAATLLSNTATPLLSGLVTSDKDKALIEQSKVNNQYTQEQIAALKAEEERKARRTANMSGKLYVPKAG